MKKPELIIRVLIASVAGEAVLVFGTTVAQEVLVDGVNWYTSSKTELTIGGVGSVLAAVLAGIVAQLIVRRNTVIPVVVLSAFVVVETSWLILAGVTTDPFWFSMAAGAALIAGFWIGKSLLDVIVPANR